MKKVELIRKVFRIFSIKKNMMNDDASIPGKFMIYPPNSA